MQIGIHQLCQHVRYIRRKTNAVGYGTGKFGSIHVHPDGKGIFHHGAEALGLCGEGHAVAQGDDEVSLAEDKVTVSGSTASHKTEILRRIRHHILGRTAGKDGNAKLRSHLPDQGRGRSVTGAAAHQKHRAPGSLDPVPNLHSRGCGRSFARGQICDGILRFLHFLREAGAWTRI